MERISDLINADRVTIFRHLAVDDLNGVQMDILNSIACGHEHLRSFLDFCDQVYSEKDSIDDISYSIEDDKLLFNIEYKK